MLVILDSLAANIAAQGLLPHLIVTPLRKAGHLAAACGRCSLLIERGTLPADHEVQAGVFTDEMVSVEAGLVETSSASR